MNYRLIPRRSQCCFTWVMLGLLGLALPARSERPGNDVGAFITPSAVRARFFKSQVLSNDRGGEQAGPSEVRFWNADAKAAALAPHAWRPTWRPTYARPRHPTLAPGQPLRGAENIVFPADSGVVDVSKAPYNARGDGRTDDTAPIQRALDDYTDKGAILYLPNGNYRVSASLRWGGSEGQQRNTVLWGQSRAGTIIQLRDHCPGFDDAGAPRGVLYTGHAPAQRFGNEIHNLTVDTGIGNPGACGAQFIANNQGGVYDVSFVSGDGQGVAGLDLGYTDEQGPCLIRNVAVLGFDTGIRVATSVDSETLEHIRVERQNRFGIFNGGQPCTVRDLRSVNRVPALWAAGGFTVLVGGTLRGLAGASSQPAIMDDALLVARDIHTAGYRVALEDRVGRVSRSVRGPELRQFLSKPAVTLFGTTGAGLNLPVRETPNAPWDSPGQWIAPRLLPPNATSGKDDSLAIQQAIDSGHTTVYLPRGAYRVGHTIILRGRVRRLIGCKAYLIPVAPLTRQNAPLFRFGDGTSPVVTVEGINTDFSSGPYFFLEHAAHRTLVMRRLAINFQGADAYHGTGPGDVYIQDVVGRHFYFHHQRLWARQFNPEGDGTHVLNDGGKAWILGLKTEGGGTLVETRAGGQTELLGGFCYAVGNVDATPMFVVDHAAAAFSFCEVCYTGKPFVNIVRETRGGVTRTLTSGNPAWKNAFTLFTARG